MGTTLIIPTIAPRTDTYLVQAMRSAEAQTLPFDSIIVEPDVDREGPAVVRNRAAAKVDTEWLAFLDDDDYLSPNHHEVLAALSADVRWPWFKVVGGTDPFPKHRGRQWNPNDPHIIPITTMIRTEAFRAVGGFTLGTDRAEDGRPIGGEDWRLWLALSEAGYSFEHTPAITWTWRHHGRNTSGLPSRW